MLLALVFLEVKEVEPDLLNTLTAFLTEEKAPLMRRLALALLTCPGALLACW